MCVCVCAVVCGVRCVAVESVCTYVAVESVCRMCAGCGMGVSYVCVLGNCVSLSHVWVGGRVGVVEQHSPLPPVHALCCLLLLPLVCDTTVVMDVIAVVFNAAPW